MHRSASPPSFALRALHTTTATCTKQQYGKGAPNPIAPTGLPATAGTPAEVKAAKAAKAAEAAAAAKATKAEAKKKEAMAARRAKAAEKKAAEPTAAKPKAAKVKAAERKTATVAAAEAKVTPAKAPAAEAATAAAAAAPTTLYTGALSATVVRVKMLSVASCFITTAGAPIMIGLSRPDLAFGMQVASASSLACFGLFTTGLLQWFVSPYVLSVRATSPHLLEVERLNFLAQRVVDVIDVRTDVAPPASVKPLSTFKGNGRIYFFDREHWDTAADRHELLDAILTKAEPVEEEEEESH